MPLVSASVSSETLPVPIIDPHLGEFLAQAVIADDRFRMPKWIGSRIASARNALPALQGTHAAQQESQIAGTRGISTGVASHFVGQPQGIFVEAEQEIGAGTAAAKQFFRLQRVRAHPLAVFLQARTALQVGNGVVGQAARSITSAPSRR